MLEKVLFTPNQDAMQLILLTINPTGFWGIFCFILFLCLFGIYIYLEHKREQETKDKLPDILKNLQVNHQMMSILHQQYQDYLHDKYVVDMRNAMTKPTVKEHELLSNLSHITYIMELNAQELQSMILNQNKEK